MGTYRNLDRPLLYNMLWNTHLAQNDKRLRLYMSKHPLLTGDIRRESYILTG
jgi:hypothetical protein